MPTTIIKHIRGTDIPLQWAEKIKENLAQSFTVTIVPDGKPSEISSRTERNRIFDLLEGTSGTEISEDWIDLLKSSRTVSPLKSNFK
ncbi:hypothetical protein [Desulfonema magnum]|uniref:Uncharacterized protein n=1 Tax=Desulfonema magnum TaxID=45655 RepID=A0A975BJS2_9BACT|nr:hypothetical protein [Desulfonema magnum]QTA86409.1 Uncharacterized protein dnm_024330 [Desulfonema magnum]